MMQFKEKAKEFSSLEVVAKSILISTQQGILKKTYDHLLIELEEELKQFVNTKNQKSLVNIRRGLDQSEKDIRSAERVLNEDMRSNLSYYHLVMKELTEKTNTFAELQKSKRKLIQLHKVALTELQRKEALLLSELEILEGKSKSQLKLKLEEEIQELKSQLELELKVQEEVFLKLELILAAQKIKSEEKDLKLIDYSTKEADYLKNKETLEAKYQRATKKHEERILRRLGQRLTQGLSLPSEKQYLVKELELGNTYEIILKERVYLKELKQLVTKLETDRGKKKMERDSFYKSIGIEEDIQQALALISKK